MVTVGAQQRGSEQLAATLGTMSWVGIVAMVSWEMLFWTRCAHYRKVGALLDVLCAWRIIFRIGTLTLLRLLVCASARASHIPTFARTGE